MKLHFRFRHLLFFCFSLLFVVSCSTKNNDSSTNCTTSSKPVNEINDSGEGVANMQLAETPPSIKDCFLAISEEYLEIPAKFRRTMVNNYKKRDVLVQEQQFKIDTKPVKYEYETDYLNEYFGYMMFSVFNEDREVNYFLRYFADSSQDGRSYVGLSKIMTEDKQKQGSFVFLVQDDKKLSFADSLFPNITLRNFADENRIADLELSPEQISHPPLLVWMPQKNNKIGVDLNVNAFGEKKTAVKNACRLTHLDVFFDEGKFRLTEARKAVEKKPGVEKKATKKKAVAKKKVTKKRRHR